MRLAFLIQIVFCASLVVPERTIAQVAVSREDATNHPSRHAWDLFLLLNHPAIDPKNGKRGAPDLNKKIGDAGEVVWETWREATPEVYRPNGARPSEDYNDMSLASTCPSGKVPEPATKKELIAALDKRTAHILFNPRDGISPVGGFGETRMNQAAYNFILESGLYNVEGQKAYAAKAIETGTTISFPVDAIEVKAAWIKFSADEVAAGLDKKYYEVTWAGGKYGLQTLHITTKEIPNWFWASFHHKDEKGHTFSGGREHPDNSGSPSELKGTVWENYVLGGTQQNFTDGIGRPDYLSDAYVEKGFTESSCITCHARASRSPSGGVLPPGASKTIADDAGVPIPTQNPAKYVDSGGNLITAPLDFVWSTIRAQELDPSVVMSDPCKPSE